VDAIARPKDDLFDNSTMTFGEHLEELRSSLVRAIIWLLVGLAVGLVFANRVVRYVQAPLKAAIAEYRVDRDLTRLGWDKDDKSLAPMRKFMMNEALVAELVYELPGEVASQLAIGPPKIVPPPSGETETAEAEAGKSDSDKSAGEEPTGDKPSKAPPTVSTNSVGQETNRPEAEEVDAKGPDADGAGVANPEASETGGEGSIDQGSGEDETGTEKRAGIENRSAEKTEPMVNPAIATAPRSEIPPPVERQISAADVLAAMGPRLDPDALAPRVLLRRSEEGLSSLKVEESFMIWVKAGLIVGAVLASPMIFYHLWSFVAAGLHAHERRYVYIYLPFSVALFVAGVSLAFFLVLQYVLNFLLQFNAGMDVAVEPRLTYYVNFVLLLPLGFGIAFQLPLVMLFLQRIDLIQTEDYIASWRIAILVIFLISMLVTPADVTSMVALALPLMFLYFLGILMCLYMPRGRGLGGGAYDPA